MHAGCEHQQFRRVINLRPHPTQNVNAGVADVPHIRSCRRRSIAGYATETKAEDEVQLRDRRNFKMGHKLKVLTNDLCHKNKLGRFDRFLRISAKSHRSRCPHRSLFNLLTCIKNRSPLR